MRLDNEDSIQGITRMQTHVVSNSQRRWSTTATTGRIVSAPRITTLRGQFVSWISAHFCVCMFLDSRDKSLKMLKICRKWEIKRSVLVTESAYNSQNAQFGLVMIVARTLQRLHDFKMLFKLNCLQAAQSYVKARSKSGQPLTRNKLLSSVLKLATSYIKLSPKTWIRKLFK